MATDRSRKAQGAREARLQGGVRGEEDPSIRLPETRLNEKTDILPAVDNQTAKWKEDYSPNRHPVWFPAPTTVDHGPANMPVNRLALAAKVVVVFLVLLAGAAALLLMVR